MELCEKEVKIVYIVRDVHTDKDIHTREEWYLYYIGMIHRAVKKYKNFRGWFVSYKCEEKTLLHVFLEKGEVH